MILVFRRDGVIDIKHFSQEVQRKYLMPNEYFSVLTDGKPGEAAWDNFIRALLSGKGMRMAYTKLCQGEKLEARDLIFSFLQFVPNQINTREVKKLLESESSRGKKAINSAVNNIESYIVEKEKNKQFEQKSIPASNNKYFAKVTAVGRFIIPLNEEYVEKNFRPIVISINPRMK